MTEFAVEEIPPYDIVALPATANTLECCSSSDAKTQLLQWNLDQTLQFQKFRFTGAFDSASDYDRLLKDFLRNAECCAGLGIGGTPETPLKLQCDELTTECMSMEYFDRLEENGITTNGHIRGCFEEVYDGMTVQDKLRELLINEDSENACIYSEKERKELIYVLFKLLVVGGSMCQPDTNMERYLDMTKGLYRDLLTVYKAPTTGNVTVSGKVFSITSVRGMDLFLHEEKTLLNTFIIIIEPIRKEISVLKNDFKPYW